MAAVVAVHHMVEYCVESFFLMRRIRGDTHLRRWVRAASFVKLDVMVHEDVTSLHPCADEKI